jgi:hypothetical protein
MPPTLAAGFPCYSYVAERRTHCHGRHGRHNQSYRQNQKHPSHYLFHLLSVSLEDTGFFKEGPEMKIIKLIIYPGRVPTPQDALVTYAGLPLNLFGLAPSL